MSSSIQPPPLAQPLLQIEQLQVHYGSVQALAGVSLQVQRGELVTLLRGHVLLGRSNAADGETVVLIQWGGASVAITVSPAPVTSKTSRARAGTCRCPCASNWISTTVRPMRPPGAFSATIFGSTVCGSTCAGRTS